jgi:peptidylprolyl isomerase
MAKAKNGDTVKVHYTGTLENGMQFDSSRERQPLEVTIGSGDFIQSFENCIIGMETGETKTVTVPPEEAYGQRLEELVVDVDKSEFPEDVTPDVGMHLKVRQPDDELIDVIIVDIDEEKVTLDANHPLAGRNLIFDIELVEIL